MVTAQQPEPPLVQVSRHPPGQHIVEVALNRPTALNAVSSAMAQSLTAELASLAADSSVRVVVLSSTSERAFCVGADLKERHGMSDEELFTQRDISRQAYAAVLGLPMPVIAAVEGYALGGGLELALSADLIVAGEGAVIGLPEVSVGLMPGGGGTQLLTRRVGWSKAASMIFTARRLDAHQGAALGVLDQITGTGRARGIALELAAEVARHSPVGLRNAKHAMRLGSDIDLRSGLDIEDECWRRTASSQDRKEGISAFNERRSPQWQRNPLGATIIDP